MKYRKKPVVIEAMQFTSETKDRCFNFINCNRHVSFENNIPTLTIQTLEGEMIARYGDWIIKGVKGEFYPIKNEVFLSSYEPIESGTV